MANGYLLLGIFDSPPLRRAEPQERAVVGEAAHDRRESAELPERGSVRSNGLGGIEADL